MPTTLRTRTPAELEATPRRTLPARAGAGVRVDPTGGSLDQVHEEQCAPPLGHPMGIQRWASARMGNLMGISGTKQARSPSLETGPDLRSRLPESNRRPIHYE